MEVFSYISSRLRSSSRPSPTSASKGKGSALPTKLIIIRNRFLSPILTAAAITGGEVLPDKIKKKKKDSSCSPHQASTAAASSFITSLVHSGAIPSSSSSSSAASATIMMQSINNHDHHDADDEKLIGGGEGGGNNRRSTTPGISSSSSFSSSPPAPPSRASSSSPSPTLLAKALSCIYYSAKLPTLADRAIQSSCAMQLLLASPQSTALLLLGIYGVMLFIWIPLYLLALLITAPGVYLLLGTVLYFCGRYFARTLSFPGNVPTVMRNIEFEYAAQMVRKLEHCSTKLKEWVADLRVVIDTTSPTPHPLLARHHIEVCFLRKHMLGVLCEALQSLVTPTRVKTELNLSESTIRDAEALRDAVGRLVCAIDRAMPIAQRVMAIHGGVAASSLQAFAFDTSQTSSFSPLPPMTRASSSPPTFSSPSLAPLHHPTLLPSFDQHPSHRRSRSGFGVVGGGNSQNDNGLQQLEAVVDAADCVRRIAPMFRRERPGDETGIVGMMKHWTRSRRRWDNILGTALMREELCKRLKARQVWVEGWDRKTKLDCCFIPAQRLHPTTGRSQGLIVYCNPNAGHYECSTHAPFSSDWVDLYTSLGCDVLLFNYRGYGRSSGAPHPDCIKKDVEVLVRYAREKLKAERVGLHGGTPHPDCIKKDVEMLVRYAREELKAERVGLHGESIGGMMACHAAARCEGVELLIADRTFSTLASVADRLMFQGAGKALHFFTGWKKLDVVEDFLSSPCYKVICCDPSDMIIHDVASLKVGVAVHQELGERSYGRWQPPGAYLIAEALKTSPCAALGRSCPSIPSTATPSRIPKLSEAVVTHWAACLTFLTKRARAQDVKDAAARRELRGALAQQRLGAAAQVGFETDSEMSEGERNSGSEEEEDDDEEEDDEVDVEGGEAEEKMMNSVAAGGRGGGGVVAAASGRGGGGQGLPALGRLSIYSGQMVIQEICRLLRRVDGLCGLLLGQAMHQGPEAIRSWTCCLLQWGPGQQVLAGLGGIRRHHHRDQNHSHHTISIRDCRTALEELVEHRGMEIKAAAEDQEIDYCIQMMVYLDERLCHDSEEAFKAAEESMLSNSSSSSSSSPTVHHYEENPSAPSPSSSSISLLADSNGHHHGNNNNSKRRRKAPDLPASSSSTSLGHLLNLQCGHNTSFSELERERLLHHLSSQGWVIDYFDGP